jgi:glucose/arabinose dehydrogenase
MSFTRIGLNGWLCNCALLMCAAPLHAATLPTGFTEFAITQVISAGTAMEFSPDGKLYVLEQAGTMEVYQGSGATAWTQVAPSNNFFTGSPLTVNSSGERGLLGIAFDPNFVSNRFLYVYYTATAPIHNRISRFTANAAGTQVVPGSEVFIMDLENLGPSNHNGGAMHFGPDGKLYVAVGENANAANAQSIANRLGKMLRLDVDNPPTYIPVDNPASISGIAGTTMGVNRAIWAAGLRNPFTFTFKPGTNLMYINDVGQVTWEEINIGAVAANYGWNTTEGPFNQPSFPNLTHPIVAYTHSGSPANYPPGSPAYSGAAITGGAFYTTANHIFPADYTDDYFYADYISSWIKRYDPTLNMVQNWATGAGNPVDLKVGSDGSLYYLSRGSSRVFRIEFPHDANVGCITYTSPHPRILEVTVSIVDENNNPIAGADVTINLTGDNGVNVTATGTTGAGGTIMFTRRVTAACYTTDVTGIVKSSYYFDGTEPANGYQKGFDTTPDTDCVGASDPCGSG